MIREGCVVDRSLRRLRTTLVLAIAVELISLWAPGSGRCDLPLQTIARWGHFGTGIGELGLSGKLFVDDSSRVYVVHAGNALIQKFSCTGHLLATVGAGVLNNPLAVTVDDAGIIYVGDDTGGGTGNIRRFSPDGASLGIWQQTGSARDIALADSGVVFVLADFFVRKYSSGGQLITEWGGSGDGQGRFDNPQGLAASPDGFVYVADPYNGLIQKFTQDGTFLDQWYYYTQDVDVDAAGRVIMGSNDTNLKVFSPDGQLLAQSRNEGSLSAVAVGPGGLLYGIGVYGLGVYYREIIVFREPPAGAEPEIVSIVDVPGDQGRWVKITWGASPLDLPGCRLLVREYAVYRRGDVAMRSEPGARRTSIALAGWEVLGTVPARGESAYQHWVPTACDSTESGICRTTLMVSSVFGEPFLEVHDSAPDSGYSVDNIPPPVPEPPLIAILPGVPEVRLHWSQSGAPDFARFGVYRGTQPDFMPQSPLDTYGTTTTPAFVDASVELGEAWYYRVAAFDDAGTFSGFSASSGTVLTGQSMPYVPSAVTLGQNLPNPFNPDTFIPLSVREAQRVKLEIFDPRGALVRVLLDGEVQPGSQRIRWDGFDRNGLEVGSGIYFYRASYGGRTATKQMVLTR